MSTGLTVYPSNSPETKLQESHRKRCQDIIDSLKTKAKDMVASSNSESESQAATIRQTVSTMMMDMLLLKRLNREVFEAVVVQDRKLDELKVS